MRIASLDPQGPVASGIADLWWFLLILGSAVFLLFVVLLFRALRKKESFDAETGQALVRRWVIGGGVILPGIVITGVFIVTIAAIRSMPTPGEEDRTLIEITGHQWWWDVVYPLASVRTANEMYLPVGEEVELRLLADDVVHSFWVPALAGKTDLLPDKITSMVIEASEEGAYRGVCAEFCGLQHANMAFTVVAVSGPEFETWLELQAEPPTGATGETAQGRKVFLDAGCGECHTIAGTSDGINAPDLSHLASRLTLAAGTFPNTPDHLRNWVTRPQEFKEGVEMDNIDLDPASLEALILYLESLE